MAETPKDRHGKDVDLGARVRLVSLDPKFIDSLPEDEKDDVCSMIGEVFEVYEIDEYGQPWIEKEWRVADDQTISHSLSLASHEMELC